MGKKEEIKACLLSGNTITGLIAIKWFGVYRNEGLPIKTVMVESNEGKTLFAKYYIPIHERVRLKKDGKE